MTTNKFDSRELAAYYGFAPCHAAVGTKLLPHLAVEEDAVAALGENALAQLVRDNCAIFEKCETALRHNGISREQLNKAFEMLKIFGHQ